MSQLNPTVKMLVHLAPVANYVDETFGSYWTPDKFRKEYDPDLLITRTFNIQQADIPDATLRPSDGDMSKGFHYLMLYTENYVRHPHPKHLGPRHQSLMIEWKPDCPWKEREIGPPHLVRLIEGEEAWWKRVFGRGCLVVFYLGED